MYKHLLIPLDGSPMAESALPVAAWLAEKLRARVTLIHVIERNAPGEVHGQPHLRDAGAAEAYLAEIARQGFAEGIRVDCHVHTAEVDSVAQSIVEHADELGHDLVVMCSHGRGRALHLILGSIAQSVIALGSLPVLITHPPAKGGSAPFSCQSILVPLDGAPDHARAVPVSQELAQACGATLHLIMVVPGLATLPGEMTVTGRMLPATTSRMLEFAFQEAEEYLRQQQGELERQGAASSFHVLRGDPARTIIDAAERSRVDLIVLATHGKAGMEALWAGSVAHRVCSQCRAPLLLLPVGKA